MERKYCFNSSFFGKYAERKMDSLESDARAYMVNNQNEPMTNASLVVKPNNTHHADQRNIPIHAKEWKR